ncbi:unnamed protein product [Porites evermanni]|uniref:Ribosomal protein S4 n=1 Tax=Porites evermanni TaxID=104178 RepID=A0ABN8T3Q9_9CNID|nr:unnamed protein product [Porites evermanni]
MGFAHYQSPKLLGSSPPIKNKHGVSRKHGNGALPYTEVERLRFGIAGLQVCKLRQGGYKRKNSGQQRTESGKQVTNRAKS